MTNKQIQNLIDKYLAGETSPAEEKKLALELQQQQNLPEEWQADIISHRPSSSPCGSSHP